MKIARFKNMEMDYFSICDWTEEMTPDSFIRVSEYVDVEFVEYSDQELVDKQIAVIDKQIQTVQAATSVKLDELEQRKAELLALPDLSEQ